MKCDDCGNELQIGEWPFCPHGFTGRSARVASAFPYTTSNITGKPIEVSSESHLKALCAEHGVTHRPDVAWLEKRHLGSDRQGRPVYKEGNGVGLPGCWV